LHKYLSTGRAANLVGDLAGAADKDTGTPKQAKFIGLDQFFLNKLSKHFVKM
jgi:hypothetical protein